MGIICYYKLHFGAHIANYPNRNATIAAC